MLQHVSDHRRSIIREPCTVLGWKLQEWFYRVRWHGQGRCYGSIFWPAVRVCVVHCIWRQWMVHCIGRQWMVHCIWRQWMVHCIWRQWMVHCIWRQWMVHCIWRQWTTHTHTHTHTHTQQIRIVPVLQAEACNTGTTQNQPHQRSNTQRTENKTTDVVIKQHSRKILMMDILMSETCWVRKTWNKIASDIKLVFHSSTITMTHGPINIRWITEMIMHVRINVKRSRPDKRLWVYQKGPLRGDT